MLESEHQAVYREKKKKKVKCLANPQILLLIMIIFLNARLEKAYKITYHANNAILGIVNILIELNHSVWLRKLAITTFNNLNYPLLIFNEV